MITEIKNVRGIIFVLAILFLIFFDNCAVIKEEQKTQEDLLRSNPFTKKGDIEYELNYRVEDTKLIASIKTFKMCIDGHNDIFNRQEILERKPNSWIRLGSEWVFGLGTGIMTLYAVPKAKDYNADHPDKRLEDNPWGSGGIFLGTASIMSLLHATRTTILTRDRTLKEEEVSKERTEPAYKCDATPFYSREVKLIFRNGEFISEGTNGAGEAAFDLLNISFGAFEDLGFAKISAQSDNSPAHGLDAPVSFSGSIISDLSLNLNAKNDTSKKYVVSKIQAEFEREIKNQESVSVWEAFVKKYPTSPQFIPKINDYLIFAKTLSENTIEAYKSFITRNPANIFVFQAQKQIEEKEYKNDNLSYSSNYSSNSSIASEDIGKAFVIGTGILVGAGYLLNYLLSGDSNSTTSSSQEHYQTSNAISSDGNGTLITIKVNYHGIGYIGQDDLNKQCLLEIEGRTRPGYGLKLNKYTGDVQIPLSPGFYKTKVDCDIKKSDMLSINRGGTIGRYKCCKVLGKREFIINASQNSIIFIDAYKEGKEFECE